MKTYFKSVDERRNKIQKVVAITFIMVAVISLMFRLIKANSYVDDSLAVAKISAQIRELSDQNAVLSEYIRSRGSLREIVSRAEQAGFVKTGTYTYLPPSINLALQLGDPQ